MDGEGLLMHELGFGLRENGLGASSTSERFWAERELSERRYQRR